MNVAPWFVVLSCALVAASCRRAPPHDDATARPASSASAGGDPSGSAPAPTTSSAPAASTEPGRRAGAAEGVDPYTEASLLAPLFVEAPRYTLAHPGFRALLEPAMPQIEPRFAGIAPADVEVQVTSLPGSRRALLVGRPAPGPRPLLYVFDAQGTMLWGRERPLGSVDPSVSRFALCPGPEGDLMVFWYDPPTQLLAARRWDGDGWLLADFSLLAAEGVTELSALHWPGHGWLAITAGKGTVRAQMFSDDARRPWGPEGRTIAPSDALEQPVAVALDTELSAVVVWVSTRVLPSGTTLPVYRARRVDVEGHVLGRADIELGEAATPAARPSIERVGPGEVRVGLRRAAGPYEVVVDAEGHVRLR